MMIRIAITVGCMFLFFASAAAQNTSIYTSTTEKACRTIKVDDSGAGSYEGECPGIGGYKLRLLEGDIRQTLDVITPGKNRFELDFWTFHGAFSYIGDQVEWRVKKNTPVALIARYYVAADENSSRYISYLIVSKIGRTSSCVTGIVEPIEKQNEKARELADAAAAKPCKAKKQITHSAP